MVGSLILGFFDGIHRGHRAVIENGVNNSCGKNLLITFKESPSVYFKGSAEYICKRNESYQKAINLGIDEIIELDIKEIVNTTALDYIKDLVNKYSPNIITSGFNHTFGYNKEGTPELLQKLSEKYNYKYIYTPPELYENEVISSSMIKSLLKEGNLSKANLLLESEFSIEGEVIHGAKIGRTIGFPTANIKYPDNIIKLPFGVYSTDILIKNNEQKFKGIMNWGIKPTLNNVSEPIAEIHIHNFDNNIYGQTLKVKIKNKIRNEVKFNSLEELKIQIKKDIEACLKS